MDTPVPVESLFATLFDDISQNPVSAEEREKKFQCDTLPVRSPLGSVVAIPLYRFAVKLRDFLQSCHYVIAIGISAIHSFFAG